MAGRNAGAQHRDFLGQKSLANRAGSGAPLPAAFFPLLGSALVNPVSPDAADDGDLSSPFVTIEGADAAKPPAPASAADGAPFNILIAPGDYPGADLVLDVDRQTNLVGLGPFGIGSFDAANRAPSGARRSVIVTASGGLPGGLRAGLSIYSLQSLGDAMTTHQSMMLKPRISGPIDFSGSAGAGSIEFSLSAEVFGTDSSSTGQALIGGGAILQSYIKYSRIRGTTVGANWNFQVAESSRFAGLVDVSGYSRIVRSRLDAGMSWSAAPAGIEPSGFMLSRLRGPFTGAGGAFLLADAYSLHSFGAGGATLPAGALVPLGAPALVQFGALDLPLGVGTTHLYPGYAPATAQAAALEWRAPRDGLIFNLRINQIPGTGGSTITYAAAAGVGLLTVQDTPVTGTGGQSSPGNFVWVPEGTLVRFTAAPSLQMTASPTQITAAFNFV